MQHLVDGRRSVLAAGIIPALSGCGMALMTSAKLVDADEARHIVGLLATAGKALDDDVLTPAS
jgi:hypothetical protein